MFFLCLFLCGGIEWLHSMDWIGHFESPALANTSSTEAFYSPRHRLMAGNRWYRPSDSRVFNSVDLHFWVHTKLSGKILAKCSKWHVPSSGLLFDLFGSIWHRALRKTQFAVNTITIVSMAVNLWFLHVCLVIVMVTIAAYVLLFVHVINGQECGRNKRYQCWSWIRFDPVVTI